MDKSKEYILMCEKAKEIQKGWKPQVGDIFFRENRDKNNTNLNGLKMIKHINDTKEILRGFPNTRTGEPIIIHRSWEDTAHLIKRIWLPRQDRLQEMIGNFAKQKDLMIMFCSPITFYATQPDKIELKPGTIIKSVDPLVSFPTYWPQFKSWEQIWLAFVMSEKYNKAWDGKEWRRNSNYMSLGKNEIGVKKL